LPQCNDTWKIYIPSTLVHLIIHWYHAILGHVVIQRLYRIITNHFYAPHLQDKIEEFVKSCDACLRFKLPGIARGELPPKDLTAQPWDEVSVD
jgi:Integrase zinc binding domain